MPAVSVIVAIYNIEKYLPRALDSLVNQTLRDIEIIAVDDGSTDSCPQIADRYAEKDPRIHVIHRKNGGLSAARNTGLSAASGDYIGYLDGDDFAEPSMYEKMFRACKDFGAGMCCVRYRIVDEDGKTPPRNFPVSRRAAGRRRCVLTAMKPSVTGSRRRMKSLSGTRSGASFSEGTLSKGSPSPKGTIPRISCTQPLR